MESRIYTASLLPFVETARHSAVVVSHGGSGGLYPAIAAGTPVLAIPSNADQHLSTTVLVENGGGLGVRVEEASAERLFSALKRIIFEPDFRAAANRWGHIFQQDEGNNRFAQFLKVIP
jgi:UDP:flavonoid glycosyltransferase YjiC (YdhE family)